jgi:hypothetical protein
MYDGDQRGSFAIWLSCGTGDTEATLLQRNKFSRLLPFSGSDLLRRQRRG